MILFNGKVPSECRGNIVRLEEYQSRLRKIKLESDEEDESSCLE